jgi:hypothetical protein
MKPSFVPTAIALLTIAMPYTKLLAAPRAREILLSAEDGKPVRPGDDPTVSTSDQLRVLDVTATGLRSIATIAVPASMVGPPESAKMTVDSRWAVVTASQRLERPPGSTPRLTPDDTVSLVDLRNPSAPRLAAVVHAGAGASGVAISHEGGLVLVANARADTISLFRLRGGTLEPSGTLALPESTRPVAVRFLPDGTAALVVSGSGHLLRIAIRNGVLQSDPTSLDLGTSASGVVLSPDGRTAYVLAAARPASTPAAHAEPYVAAIDIARLKIVARITLPSPTEGLALSPSGRFLEATLLNGTNLAADGPGFNRNGIIAVISTQHAKLSMRR